MSDRVTTPLALLLSVSLSLGAVARAAEPGAAPGSAAAESARPSPEEAVAAPGPAGSASPKAGSAARAPSGSPAPAPPVAEVAPPSETDLERARRHFDTALDRYSRGLYREAIRQLELAREIDPEGKDLVYNLALVHEKLGELEQSLAYYREYLAMESDEDERARTEASIVRLEGALEQERLQAEQPANSRVLSPRAPPTPRAPGHADEWVWATAGISVVALLTGVVLGVRALALSPGMDAPTGGSRSADEYRNDAQDAHRSAVAADIAFAVGLGAGAASALLYFGRARPAHPELSGVEFREPRRPAAELDLGVRF